MLKELKKSKLLTIINLEKMYALNRAQIIGHLTEDPQVKTLDSGTTVTDLNIEIKTHNPNQNSESKMLTSYVSVTLWRRLAEIAGDFLRQGTQVYLSGRLETDSWEDDQGKKKYKTRMVAEDMIMLSPKSGPLAPLPESISIQGGLNQVEVVGNVTKDPELKTTPSGTNVCSFSVATNRVWKSSSGESQEKTEFHNIVTWDNLAEEVAKHIPKGRKVYLRGRLQNRSWEAPDGTKRYTTEVVATELKSLGHGISAGVVTNIEENVDNTPNIDAANNIPDVNYESEIKPEDLPF